MLSVKNRLRSRKDIIVVLKRGFRVRGNFFRLTALLKQDSVTPRIAVAVSIKEVKKATHRNRIKRRTRAVALKTVGRLIYYDVVIFPTKEAEGAPFHALAEELYRHAENLQNRRIRN